MDAVAALLLDDFGWIPLLLAREAFMGQSLSCIRPVPRMNSPFRCLPRTHQDALIFAPKSTYASRDLFLPCFPGSTINIRNEPPPTGIPFRKHVPSDPRLRRNRRNCGGGAPPVSARSTPH